MIRKNTSHQPSALISAIYDLPQNQCERLEGSWAGTFWMNQVEIWLSILVRKVIQVSLAWAVKFFQPTVRGAA